MLFLLPLFAFAACDGEEDALLEDLMELQDGDLSDATVEEMERAVGLLRDEVERTVEAGIHLVNYYKMAAQQLMSRELYGLAAHFYREALDLQPTNKLVAYKLGVTTAQVARSQAAGNARTAGLEEALDHYLYALELDPTYADALYAVSILYIFEFDNPGEAERYLERLLAERPGHTRGMFLLARVYVEYGRIDDAISLYDEIIRESENEEEIEQARRNRSELTGSGNGI